MCTAGIESNSLPHLIICKSGAEDCGTVETQSLSTKSEEETREECGDSLTEQVNAKTMEDTSAPALISSSQPSKATLAEDNQDIAATTMSIIPAISTSDESSSKEVKAISIEKTAEIPSVYVGRIIGKGGEMIRDLQARSGCHIDVNQNVKHGAPKIITYRGRNEEDIELAKQLVAMLCTEDVPNREELPLGRATMKEIQVPNSVIGRIIGRHGEMIRKLQSKSQARIQVDHSVDAATGMDTEHRHITITGTKDSVAKAEKMILLLSAEKHRDDGHGLQWMFPPANNVASTIGGPYWTTGGQTEYAGCGVYYGSQQGLWDAGNEYAATPALMETNILPCSKKDIGHIIGPKGATIDDLQQRSNCNIQIDQQDCQISITGPRQGIDMAKRMLRDIIERGLHHPDDNGRQLKQQEDPSFQQKPGYLVQQGYPSPVYGMIPPNQQYYGGQPIMMYNQQYSMQQSQQHYAQRASSPWRAATTIDGNIYYYNQDTLETRWEKPAEME